MLGAIKYNLANLANPAGRDARQTFWYYMLFLVITQVVVSTIAAMPMYIAMFGGAIDAAQSGANEQEMNALMFANMRGHLHTQMWVGAVMGLIMAALFSAAFVRRLHDSGKPGWLLLLVLLREAAVGVRVAGAERLGQLAQRRVLGVLGVLLGRHGDDSSLWVAVDLLVRSICCPRAYLRARTLVLLGYTFVGPCCLVASLSFFLLQFYCGQWVFFKRST